MKNLSLLLAVVGTTASIAIAVPRETRTFAGPYNLPGGPIGNPTINTSFTGVDGGPYVATQVVVTGTIDTIVTGTTPAQISAFLIPPGGAEPFQVTLSGSFAAAPASVNFRAQIALPVDVTSVAGDWSIVLQDSTNNGTGADATVSNLAVIMDDGTITADQTINPLPAGETTGTVTMSGGDVKWIKFTTTTDATAAGLSYLDIQTTSGGDTEIGLYDNAGNLLDNDDDTLGVLSVLTYGSGGGTGGAFPFDGFNGDLTAGTYWLAIGFFNMNFNAAGFNAVATSALAGDIGFAIRQGAQEPPAPPAVVEAVGQIGTTTPGVEGVITRTHTVADGNDVKWYTFSLGGDALQASTFYVDIDTEGTGPDVPLVTGNIVDTEIGVFRSGTGALVAADDDGGSDQRSALSFGDNVNIRPAVPTGASAAGADRNGRNGDLVAGDYYLSVSTFNTNFANGWSAIGPADRAASTGDRVVNFRSNLPALPPNACPNPSNVSGPGQNTVTIDEELTADDIIVFLNRFFAGNSLSNVSGPGQNTTLLDNELTADDIIVFLNRFFAGC